MAALYKWAHHVGRRRLRADAQRRGVNRIQPNCQPAAIRASATPGGVVWNGYGVCDQITAGVSYSQLIKNIKGDFSTSDEFQASYLISQSAQELCPAAIWQLRQSAAGYRPST
ncbi:DUF732 domain-containing protein (plasmid) [Mycolicibacterium psychrotolerans]|uniref:DUF732 domain-containing protein n=1 Tax=Mycolicibacterium psychrotolerans TaxID=216929 RepID=UPI003D67F2E8